MKSFHSGVVIVFLIILSIACDSQPGGSSFLPATDSLFAILVPENLAGNMENSGNWKEVDGIPFYRRLLWEPEEPEEYEAQWGELKDEYQAPAEAYPAKRIPLHMLEARHLYIAGCLNSIDIPNPSWGGGDGYRNFFIGDTTGYLSIAYQSGLVDRIPLVYGYTAWWHACYAGHPEPFRSDEDAREMLDKALQVINGIDGYQREGDEYYLKIALRKEPLSWIELEDNPSRIGYFRMDGICFGDPVIEGRNVRPDYILKMRTSPLSPQKERYIDAHIIASANPFPQEKQEAIAELRHIYYSFESDICDRNIGATPPDVKPEHFPGPRVSLRGSPEATLLTRIYYDNSLHIMNCVDDSGMVHESARDADNYQSFGSWNESLGAFYDCAYTRNRSLIVLSNYGLEEKVNKGVDFFDHWMMYYPKSFPEIQLGGKPVPGHASVIANTPHVYFDKLRHVGWRTRYKTRDFGNTENDGHGFLMLSRYRAWSKQGREKAWVLDRWEAIEEAAEYIPWCLDNPDLSFSEYGLLYNESEGGMLQQSMYCDYLCYLGLLAYSEMAEVAGKVEFAERWEAVAGKLYEAMEAYYPARIEPWGDVWDPEKNAMFLYINSTLAPACIGMDYHGYNVMRELPEDWISRTRNTYRMQLTRCRPDFAASAGIGYGQCYLAQTALLLDEMEDADRLLGWLARFCFTPRLDHPYRVPEGSTVSEDGQTWRRWGDLGNLYQTVDVIHTLHLMIGIDDINPERLTLMPRLNGQVDRLTVREWPTRFISEGVSVLEPLDMEVDMDREGRRISCSLNTARQVDHVRIRLGPLPPDARQVDLKVNGEEAGFERFRSGSSDWLWIPTEALQAGETKIILTYI